MNNDCEEKENMFYDHREGVARQAWWQKDKFAKRMDSKASEHFFKEDK